MKNTYRDDEAITAALNVSQIKRLMKYIKPYKKQVLITIVLMFAAAVTELIGPYLLQKAIDDYIPVGRFIGLCFIAILFVSSTFFNCILNRWKIKMANRTGQYVLLDIRKELFNKVQSLSFNFFDNTSAGKIIVRVVNDVNTLNNLFTNGIITVVTDISMIVVAVAIMVAIHPKLALVSFTTVPFFTLIIIFTRNAIKREWRQVRRKLSNLNAYIHESISGMRVIQAYVRQRKNREIFHNVIDDIIKSWMKAIRINSGFGPMVEVISILGTLLIYWYGSKLLSVNEVTVGVLVAFTAYLKRFWNPIITLTNFYNQLLVAMASSERIFELMDETPDIIALPDAEEMPKVDGNVEFENVAFSYDREKAVLKDVSFKVKAGETIAIVGPTGSGKTTIVNLLARFYDAVSGRVLIDGYDVKQVTLESLRKRVGIMLQDPFIFSGTVMENIKYGKLEASDEEVEEVAKAVNAHDFIVDMEEGYNTIVNERGSRLSIGQRQLIAFARVLLADPDILILDEATASIDTHTEILLQNAVNKVLEGRTSFIIAHRLSTIRNADRIMLVKDGEVVESGSHDELIALGGLYNRMYSVQYEHLKGFGSK